MAQVVVDSRVMRDKARTIENAAVTIVKDIKAYSAFLNQAAEGYEAAEREGTQKAAEQGKVF